MFEWVLLPEARIALVTLTALEIVLAIGVMMFAAKSIGELVDAHPGITS
jgi:predicted tellurium resistance membrane protein TerC